MLYDIFHIKRDYKFWIYHPWYTIDIAETWLKYINLFMESTHMVIVCYQGLHSQVEEDMITNWWNDVVTDNRERTSRLPAKGRWYEYQPKGGDALQMGRSASLPLYLRWTFLTFAFTVLLSTYLSVRCTAGCISYKRYWRSHLLHAGLANRPF